MSWILIAFYAFDLILGGYSVYKFVSDIENPNTSKLRFHYGPSLDDYEIFNLNETTKLLEHPKFVHGTTHLYIPGLTTDQSSESVQVVTEAYLKRGSINIVVFDWPTKSNSVTSVFMNIPSLAAVLANTILSLYNAGLPRESLTLLGYSLGAHIAGQTGREVMSRTNGQVKLYRIAALDATYAFYWDILPLQATTSVNKNDAEHVQAIHTSNWFGGQPHSIGHIDFFPNGGSPVQPGCLSVNVFGIVGCSHSSSWRYWSESVEKSDGSKFLAFPSSNYLSFLLAGRNNLENEPVEMGCNCPIGPTGDYYLKTNGEYPFAMGMDTLE